MMPSAMGRHIKLLAIENGFRRRLRKPQARRFRIGAIDSAAAGLLPPLPLAAAWLKGSRDPVRDQVIAVLEARLKSYAREA
ncbi:hypothetical protein SAMN05216337_103545 [Bradyrhizobium brasilense]|uniref:Uncharacterized protein n=1 Tax=Bradyrhizobium brasilense TaxID=1419277 RepID=A0A1G7FUV2_9BRAD|nr:hypothetical protein SAMN05216337_103545 [Bradyrhizobium brasilense]